MSAYCVPSLSPGFSTYSSSTSHSKACLLGFVFVTVAPTVRRLPAMPETQARPLGREDPLEKETTPTPGSLPGKSPGRRSLVGSSPGGRRASGTTERLRSTLAVLRTALGSRGLDSGRG